MNHFNLLGEISNSEIRILTLDEETTELNDKIKLLSNKMEITTNSLGENKEFLKEAMIETQTEEDFLNKSRKKVVKGLKKASKLHAEQAKTLEEEVKKNIVIIKDMLTSKQIEIPNSDIIKYFNSNS